MSFPCSIAIKRGTRITAKWHTSEDVAIATQPRFVPVDIQRESIPVSRTAIRVRSIDHWQRIPECVRPYFVKRVCLIGPESTRNSTLARDLAAHFATVYVPEFARGWLNRQQGVCHSQDIAMIARGQIASEDTLARYANYVLFCDTDLLLTTGRA